MAGDIEYHRKWRKNNKDKIKEYKKKYNSKPSSKMKARDYRKATRHKSTWHLIKYKYGLTKEQWETLYNEQGGVCKICSNLPNIGRALHTDHSHKTGRVRGLLCTSCNLTLGKYEDNPEWLVKMISYIVENNWIIDKEKDIKNPFPAKVVGSMEQGMDSSKTKSFLIPPN